MAFKRISSSIIIMVILASMLIGCSSTQMEPTPTQVEPTATLVPEEPEPTPTEPPPTPAEPSATPEPQIVWSDDFEDGDTAGWQEAFAIHNDEFFGSEGALSFGKNGGDTRRPSNVSIGTWSLDVNLPDTPGPLADITFAVAEFSGNYRTIWIYFENKQDTVISLRHFNGSDSIIDGEAPILEGEKVSGWHHIDITRDHDDHTKVYVDGKLCLDALVKFPFESDYFYVNNYIEGPAYDNIVVRNYVIEIEPTTE